MLVTIKSTISIIYLKLNKYYDYTNIESIKNNIAFICGSVNSPYNDDAFFEILKKRDSNEKYSNKKVLLDFISYCTTKDLTPLNLNESEKRLLNNTISNIFKRS